MDGRTGGQPGRQIDMTKLIVAVRNFSNAPKKPGIRLDDCYFTN